jgi:predicted nuclease of predicted toxin-antitoxin system
MEWARRRGFVVFTHDLDYGALLAATGAVAPSVIQLRSEDTRPATMASMVIAALRSHGESLDAGALMTVDPRRMRITLLPLKKS